MIIHPRNIFLRKDLPISSRNKYKRAMVTGFLSVTCMLIGFFYLVYNRMYEIDDAYVLYCVMIASGLCAFFFNRNGYHVPAKILILLTGIGVTFIFSTMANFQTDAHFFYIAISLSAFALFGYERKGVAILFSAATLIVFYVSFATHYSPLPHSGYPEQYIRAFQVINFSIAMVASGLILLYMVRLNYMSEKALNKKRKKIIAQNEALTKTNTELDHFVYSASHDLRAPLASVLGLIHIARMSKDPQEIFQYLDMMAARVNRLDEFVHEIIDFAKNSRTDVKSEDVQVHRTVQHVLDNLRHYMTSETIDFYIDIPNDLCLRTDQARLTIILNNLIGNAIKYYDSTKQKPFVRIIAEKGATACAISINDNGIGIEREHHSRIFDMFYRASERSKGSGLGLYIVKESVHKLAGSIDLESQPGVGSTFTITIPENLN